MKELRLIETKEIKQAVLLRDVHEELELSEKYADWWKRQLELFMQGVDFIEVQVNRNINNVKLIDHAVTLDTAKHIALMSRTEKGKEYRTYLIKFEENHRKHILNSEIAWIKTRLLTKDSYKRMADALVTARTRIGKETKPFHYANEAKMINAICGLPTQNNRDELSKDALDKLDLMTDLNTSLIRAGYVYEKRKRMIADAFMQDRLLETKND